MSITWSAYSATCGLLCWARLVTAARAGPGAVSPRLMRAHISVTGAGSWASCRGLVARSSSREKEAWGRNILEQETVLCYQDTNPDMCRVR